MKITKLHIEKLKRTIDAGLCQGLGEPVPGKMCVEAAVCYALGLPHGDDPTCVSRAVRAVKIKLNDSAWSSDAARAKGLKKLAIAQLGSDTIDDTVFAVLLAEKTIRVVIPRALRAVATRGFYSDLLEAAAIECEQAGNVAAANAAAFAARFAARTAAKAADSAAAVAAADAAADAAVFAARAAADAAAFAARTAAKAAAFAARTAAKAADSAAAVAAADAAAKAAAFAAAVAARTAAKAADSAAKAADSAAAARDRELAFFADLVIEILKKLNAPGLKWLETV